MVRLRKKRDKILTIGVIAALLAAVGAAVFFILHKDTLVIKEDVRISMLGREYDFSGKSKLVYDDRQMAFMNGSTYLILEGVPAYLPTEDKLIFTKKMIYNNYSRDMLKRVNYFAYLSEKDGAFAVSIDGKHERDIQGGFFFDGKNTYVFLDPMTVTWGNRTMELAPMSYIYVSNKNCFYYYSSGDEESGYEDCPDDTVRAVPGTGEYKLNLSNDIIDLSNGKSLLLIPNPEMVELLQ